MYKVLGFILLLLSGFCSSGELVKNAEITRIGSSSDGTTDNFFITVSSNDNGPCANGHITFPRDQAPSDGFFNRLYSTALMAYAAGSKNIRVVNVGSSSCSGATYIEVAK